jgi:hypothetical protein
VTWKRALILTSASFGLGLGLARTTPVAHACKCDVAYWQLELESIDDISEPGVTGDLEGEQAYWPAEASISGGWEPVVLGNGDVIDLARVP